MPFLLVPMLWDALSRPLRVSGAAFERMHGDSLTVGYDSPDAFDEIVWRTFWPRKDGRDRMSLWSEPTMPSQSSSRSFGCTSAN